MRSEFKMAMKLATEAVKMRFPNVPNVSTEELCQLMKEDSSKQKLILLVSRMPNCARVLHNSCRPSLAVFVLVYWKTCKLISCRRSFGAELSDISQFLAYFKGLYLAVKDWRGVNPRYCKIILLALFTKIFEIQLYLRACLHGGGVTRLGG